MIRYKTAAKEAHAEQIIDKSRFIAHIRTCLSREEAEEYIRKIRSEYKDASHNVPCFILGEKQEIMWQSDDGEPSGTSGSPMLQMLAKEGLTNIVCVVTRYFGGIKLGTGGLVRAYTSSARLALDAAGIHIVKDVRRVRIRIPYSLLERVRKNVNAAPYELADIEYADDAAVSLVYSPEDEEKVLGPLREMTSGNLVIIECGDSIQ